jgi:hypothetical protein
MTRPPDPATRPPGLMTMAELAAELAADVAGLPGPPAVLGLVRFQDGRVHVAPLGSDPADPAPWIEVDLHA